jgi:Icc-related predicted phosphoesterase
VKRKVRRLVLAVAALAGASVVAVALVAVTGGPRAPTHPNPAGEIAAREIAPSASGAFSIIGLADLKARPGVLFAAYEDARANAADAIIVGGDLVQFDSAFEYGYAVSLLERAPAGIPHFLVFGNHEAWDRFDHLTGRERFRATFGPTQSWFRTQGILFVAADTGDYDFPEARAAELDAILTAERPRSRLAVILTHELPFFGTQRLKDKRGYDKQLAEPDSARMAALVEKHDVCLVLGGHFHGYASGKIGRAAAIVSGGGGAPLDGPDEYYHYVRVKIHPEGAVTHEVVRHDNHAPEWLRYRLLQNANPVAGALAAAAVVAGIVAWMLGRGKPTA